MPIIGSASENSLSSRLAGDLLSVNLLQSEITWTTEPSLLVQRVQSFRCKLSATFRNDFMRAYATSRGFLKNFGKASFSYRNIRSGSRGVLDTQR